MNAKARFISTLFVIDAFFFGYVFGFNSRQVEIVDPSLQAVAVKAPAPSSQSAPSSNPANSSRRASSSHPASSQLVGASHARPVKEEKRKATKSNTNEKNSSSQAGKKTGKKNSSAGKEQKPTGKATKSTNSK